MLGKIAPTLLLAAVSAGIACLAVDLAYRVWIEPEDIVPRSLGRFDEHLGWGLVPGAEATSTGTGTPVRYAINSRGFRDDEIPLAKPPDELRIVVLGDSRTFGYGVAIEQHFSRVLEGYFAGVEVVNLGVSGYGVDQELLVLRREGLRYQPDLVMAYVAHFGDERHMFAERWGKPKPRFVMGEAGLELTNVPVPTEYAGLDLPHRVDLFLVQRSPLYRDVSKTLIGLIKRALGEGPTEAPPAPTASSDFVDRMYELGAAILGEIDREATAAGARFVLITQLPRLHRMCGARGIPSIDVSDALRNERFELPYGLEHVNEAGNGVLAWELANFLVREGLIPASRWAADAG